MITANLLNNRLQSNFYRVLTALLVLMLSSWDSFAEDQEKLLKAYSSLPTFFNPVLSPSGKKLAYTTAVEGRRQLVITNPDGSEPLLVTAPEKQSIVGYRWASEKYLVYNTSFSMKRRRARSWTQEIRWYRLNLESGSTRWLGAPDRTNFTETNSQLERLIDVMPNDPDHVMMGLDLNRNGSDEVYSVNLETGFRKIVKKEQRGVLTWHVGPGSVVRMATGVRGRKTLTRLRKPSGDWQNITAFPWGNIYEVEAFDKDPNVLIASKRNNTGNIELHRIDMTTGESLDLIYEDKAGDFSSLRLDGKTHTLIGINHADHFPRTTYLDSDYAKAQSQIDALAPQAVNSIVQRAGGAATYLVRTQNTASPGAYYVFDAKKQTLNPITSVRRNIDSAGSALTRFYEIPARDDEIIPTYVTLPKGKDGTSNLPTVIMPHGGPHGVRDDARWDYTAQYYAQLGYAVVKPNFRGSGGYGAEFERAGNQQWGGLMQDDVTDVTRWLIDKKIADPKRICIVGGSYGGYAALMGTIKEPDLYRCAVSINGVTDLKLQQRGDTLQIIGGWRWKHSFGLKGQPIENVSPYHRADDINTPVMIIAAVDDARVHYKRSEDMHERLEKLGKDSTFVRIERGGHSLNTEQSRYIMLKSIGEFLDKHIGSKQ